MEKLEQLLENSPTTDSGMVARLAALERQLAALKETGLPDLTEQACTAVLGGLGGLTSKEEGETWLKDKLTVLRGPGFTETYCKGDWKGLLFAKFPTKTERDTAVTKLRQARVEQAEGQTVWAKADKPLEKRVAATFLFGLKKTLVEKWGYSKTIVWVDEEKLTLKVRGELVVTVQVVQEAAGSEGTGVKD